MASETFARGDVLANRGTPLIDDTNDLCPNNVGGQIVPVMWTVTFAGTKAAVPMILGASTLTQFVPFKNGSIIGLGVRLSRALTAGDSSAAFAVYKGATSTGFSVTIDGTARSGTASQAKDTDTFVAGNVLSVRLTAGAIGTTITAQATAFFEM